MLALFTLTILLSASLLFLVQPMAGKMLLPLAGGSPAVWNTCMVFFQAALLGGYLYSHLLTSRLTVRAQAVVHAALVLAAAASLPMAVRGGQSPPSETIALTFWLVKVLALSVGLPFLIVSTTGPLVQSWFSRTDHPRAKDPYFLYAASNIGSAVGLLGYPLLVEPRLRLAEQAWAWAAGYAVLGALLLSCAARAMARPLAPAAAAAALPEAPEPLTAARRLKWIVLAAVPSSLMLGLTQHVSTDIAAVPLLWVIPLFLYLLTFTIAFSPRMAPRSGVLGWILVPLVLAQAAVMGSGRNSPWLGVVALHTAGFVVATLMCHTRLAEDRPRTSRLTDFYLCLAVGGVLGGLVNALIAPAIFPYIAEYPIAIAAACMLRPPGRVPVLSGWRARLSERTSPRGRWLLPVWTALAVCTVLAVQRAGWTAAVAYNSSDPAAKVTTAAIEWARVCVPLALAVWLLWTLRGTLAFGLTTGAALLTAHHLEKYSDGDETLTVQRSFFSSVTVYRKAHPELPGEDSPGGPPAQEFWFSHGTTLHGAQLRGLTRTHEADGSSIIAEGAGYARVYHHRQGPVGEIYDSVASRAMGPGKDGSNPTSRVAVLGLGAGAMAAYAQSGQTYDFYEIDPMVQRIAEDPRCFTYLADARGRGAGVNVVIGDGRLKLAESAGDYGMIFFDAFSSDSIPVHLATLDAARIYLGKLREDGVLVFHVSNRFFRVWPVIARIAGELGLHAYLREWGTSDDESQGRFITPRRNKTEMLSSGTWVVLARSPRHVGWLADDPMDLWTIPQPPPGTPLWTDDFSNVLSVLESLGN